MIEGPSKEDIERWKNGSYTRQKLNEFDKFKHNVQISIISLLCMMVILFLLFIVIILDNTEKANNQVKTNKVEEEETQKIDKDEDPYTIEQHVEYVVYTRASINNHSMNDNNTVDHTKKYYVNLQRVRNQNYEYVDGYISKEAYNKIKKNYVVYVDVKWSVPGYYDKTAIPSIYKLYTLEGELIYTEGDEE
ncbi:hypothetical protein [uncultured Clostridium sp.]|uniref:hypothetical protein n=1 Tax=uncultured Clostridium sp. TaxID=59620 RepID=UPI00263B4630|nr:hypothetical protein [uncultured Clostridium sp.]